MAKKKAQTATRWRGFDDERLADLHRIVGEIRSNRFRLESLRGTWDKMPYDEIDPLVDSLQEVADELAEVYENLEEERDAEDDNE